MPATHRSCNVCAQDFPRTAEFWHKHPKGQQGLGETCKECAKERQRKWYLANRDSARAQQRGYREENHESVLAGKLRYRAANAKQINATQQAKRAANPEKHRASSKQWRLNNPEKDAAQKRADYLANADAFKQRAREWVKANPERVKVRTAKRRAAFKNAPGRFTEADLLRQFETQQGKCFYCAGDLQNEGTIDHYIPLSKGGTNYPSNIVLACWPCNNSKRAKLPSDFRSK